MLGCRYSIGSSSVMMCFRYVALIRSRSEASVDVLPEPVGPVTRTMPPRRWISVSSEAGRLSSFRVGISTGMRR